MYPVYRSLVKEWAAIRSAPFTFALVLLLLAGTSFSLCYRIFQNRLNARDDLIRDYQQKLGIAPGPYSSVKSQQLKEAAGRLVLEIRNLRRGFETPPIPTNEQTNLQKWQSKQEWLTSYDDRTIAVLVQYQSRYALLAIALHNEMYARIGRSIQLPAQPNVIRHNMLYPADVSALDVVADDLELLSKSLP